MCLPLQITDYPLSIEHRRSSVIDESDLADRAPGVVERRFVTDANRGVLTPAGEIHRDGAGAFHFDEQRVVDDEAHDALRGGDLENRRLARR